MDKIGLSQTKACAVATCNRKTFRRVLRRLDDGPLLEQLRKLAAERRRFGYRRLGVMLRRDGVIANHKRVFRVYRSANLQVRKRTKRRVAFGRGEPPIGTTSVNERWSLDFVHDTFQSSRRIRALTIVDDFTRESLAIEVDTSISGTRMTTVLDRIADERGYLADWPLSEPQKAALLARNYNRLLDMGGNIYFLAKVFSTDGLSFLQAVSTMTGMSVEDYAAMMNAGGRSPEGLRSIKGAG